MRRYLAKLVRQGVKLGMNVVKLAVQFAVLFSKLVPTSFVMTVRLTKGLEMLWRAAYVQIKGFSCSAEVSAKALGLTWRRRYMDAAALWREKVSESGPAVVMAVVWIYGLGVDVQPVFRLAASSCHGESLEPQQALLHTRSNDNLVMKRDSRR